MAGAPGGSPSCLGGGGGPGLAAASSRPMRSISPGSSSAAMGDSDGDGGEAGCSDGGSRLLLDMAEGRPACVRLLLAHLQGGAVRLPVAMLEEAWQLAEHYQVCCMCCVWRGGGWHSIKCIARHTPQLSPAPPPQPPLGPMPLPPPPSALTHTRPGTTDPQLPGGSGARRCPHSAQRRPAGSAAAPPA